MKNKIVFIGALLFVCITNNTFSQSKIINQIVAKVGGDIILQSDIEDVLARYGGMEGDTKKIHCSILEQLILQKLLVHQAKIDSIEVSDAQVDAQFDRQLREFIKPFGSEKKLEEYYGKSILEIKEEFKGDIRDKLLIERMQQNIIGNVKVSPLEIKQYFDEIPADSLPLVNSEVIVAHIVKIPVISTERKKQVKDKLEDIRQRVIAGENMATMAASHSQDPGSAANGGEIKDVVRGTMVKEFEAMAFSLDIDEISEIFETEYGYHFIQLTDRRGEVLDIRHILLKLSPAIEELGDAETTIDSIANIIATVDSATFESAASMFSDDSETKNNGGVMINPLTGNTLFDMSQIGDLQRAIAQLEVGGISKPVLFVNAKGKQGVRIVKLIKRTDPHKANLKDDYQKIKGACESKKKQDELANWIDNKGKRVFIKVIDEFNDCKYNYSVIN